MVQLETFYGLPEMWYKGGLTKNFQGNKRCKHLSDSITPVPKMNSKINRFKDLVMAGGEGCY